MRTVRTMNNSQILAKIVRQVTIMKPPYRVIFVIKFLPS